jgi:hypothetical protein
MKSTWIMTLCFSSFGLLVSQIARAQVCEVTDANVTGSYGFIASEGGTVATTSSTGTTTTTTGTTGTTGTGTTGAGGSAPTTSYSNTQIGLLLGGIAAGDQFAYSGVLTFDGSGNIFATSAPTGTAVAQVGTYTVNSDCSITISLMDAFGTNTMATQFAGIIMGHGSEIDLTSATNLQSQAGTGSTSTTTTSTGTTTTSNTQTGTGLVIKLVRLLYQNGCADSDLKRRYGFVLSPVSMQSGTNSTATPSALIGYLYFDGAGNIISTAGEATISVSTSSTTGTGQTSSTPAQTYSALQFTGTYSVNANCTGTMTISNSSASSTTTTGTSTGTTTTTGSTGTTTSSNTNQSITVNFVLSPPMPSVGAQTPVLSFSYFTAAEAGTGYAFGE